MENESMNKLSETFDTTFDVEKQMAEIDERKQQLIKKTNETGLKDQEFLESEMKSLILGSRSVLQKLEEDIRVGTHARTFEVYAKLLEAVLKQYQELRELNKVVYDINKDQGKVDGTNIGNKKITMDASQLLDLVDKAREKNTMKAVDASFEIDEGDKK